MTTLQAVQEILKANFDLGPVVPQPDTALEDLDIDSLAVIEVLFEVEEKFGITVPSEPASIQARLKTIGDLVAYIDELIAAQGPARVQAEPAP
jgi:acyl carrier protein